ncbi:DNA polymerase IV [Actinorhabdospora filicis]|uniref:DNA polymerase IV n=1 Tax=Actinorhabdospora filicis TaxID=1785913 RepID=A0A9W6SFL8_9ACTN|nr:DNA polymerase IV [Actinorhabdospora filicis]GLZ75423.1 DNA polymerase IV [Actinorhabdospora filicis]
MTSAILHVDMDAFFASVEMARHPELRHRPVIVGGLGPRGVVSAANYAARAFGVHSALPMAIARRRCPRGAYLQPDGAEYRRVSKAVMRIFRDVTPLVEPLSVDEAFLDVTGARRLFGEPVAIARSIRERVAAEHGITCTVGVAQTKFIAKLASTKAKPDGLLVIEPDGVLDFLHPLPVSDLWGVGERTAASLARLGLHTVGDVAALPVARLKAAVGQAAALHLHELASGRDARAVTPHREEKSIGAEVTFDVDVSDPAVLRKALLELSDKVAGRARRAGYAGRTVAVKIRFGDFRTISRSRTVHEPVDVARDLFTMAHALVTENAEGHPLRLVGVRLEGLVESDRLARQPALGEPEHGWRQAETTVDGLRERFGSKAVRPASLLDPAPGDL